MKKNMKLKKQKVYMRMLITFKCSFLVYNQVQKTLQTHYITKASICFASNLNTFFISDAIIGSQGVPTYNNDCFMGYLNMLDIPLHAQE
jgi:hypothetical protein